ncbi:MULTISPECIES: PadR family transcriptional regulator [Mycobacterium]|uniref:Transcriptional regulator PadR-like family protein n=1 Tax=Mycobacterium intracellulare 1956 TaxID=1299331 RepID=X8CEG8_MYCIT|nr:MULTISPECIES: PadR family transcriptional regulator [Mycobacterium]EUA54216.1 transcriptional regulator PadR-like family protein [Mycobacterium intracellulare 1956]ASW83559.1 PadR family transcriptional regulator [Mycobacterium intracellulare]ASW93406.1 PadR family transcriptional regulator [Mycobacterium intracellulare]EUA29588.1 transcriptional regulator PadR-like family protein [Mycobacterium intracellulare]MCA2233387.1 PadR family transcriptional regulator [Mycobacterium intracellulare]
MSLRDAVLAALLEGESSGYDLAKGFDASVANFWPATPQQLYRELDRLAEQGLIRARVVRQERRPNKRMFSLTEAGREAIRQFTAKAPKPSVIRDELLVKVQAADAGDMPAVRESILERMQWARAKLQRYERLRARMMDGRTEKEYLAHTDRVGPYLTLVRGISFEEENIRWAEQALAVIERRLSAIRGSR